MRFRPLLSVGWKWEVAQSAVLVSLSVPPKCLRKFSNAFPDSTADFKVRQESSAADPEASSKPSASGTGFMCSSAPLEPLRELALSFSRPWPHSAHPTPGSDCRLQPLSSIREKVSQPSSVACLNLHHEA